MKEICHKSLTRLVGMYGTVKMKPQIMEQLIDASVYPDVQNKEKIEKNPLNIIRDGIQWGREHSIEAKSLAIHYLREAVSTHDNDDQTWVSYLGWAIHFITDWGTPYHSPDSKSNPIPKWMLGGTIITGLLGLLVNSRKGFTKALKGSAKWGLAGGIASTAIGAVQLAIDHTVFEDKSDEIWKENTKEITNFFKSRDYHPEVPVEFEQAIESFQKMMDFVRCECDNLPANWIMNCSIEDFSKYMILIATVMDFACQIVMNI